LYTTRRLQKIDANTVGCRAESVTYIPLPAGVNVDKAGLLTVDVPAGIRRGERYDVVVRQFTHARTRRRPLPQPEGGVTRAVGGTRLIEWRRVFGAFQVAIPVHTKAILLPR